MNSFPAIEIKSGKDNEEDVQNKDNNQELFIRRQNESDATSR